MFNKDGEKPKEGSGGGGGGSSGGPRINLPKVEIAGGEVQPQKVNMPSGPAYGFKFVKKFYAAGGKVSSGYRKVADGCAKRGKTRGKMV
jgi:hypothetical protein